jgi:hypothetical protein
MVTTKKGNKTVNVKSYRRAKPHQKSKTVQVKPYRRRE